MDSNKLFITTDAGEEREMNILFTFDSEQYGKSYVLFFDPEKDETEIFCMAYDEEGNLFAVENDDEWDMVEEMLEGFADGQEHKHEA